MSLWEGRLVTTPAHQTKVWTFMPRIACQHLSVNYKRSSTQWPLATSCRTRWGRDFSDKEMPGTMSKFLQTASNLWASRQQTKSAEIQAEMKLQLARLLESGKATKGSPGLRWQPCTSNIRRVGASMLCLMNLGPNSVVDEGSQWPMPGLRKLQSSFIRCAPSSWSPSNGSGPFRCGNSWRAPTGEVPCQTWSSANVHRRLMAHFVFLFIRLWRWLRWSCCIMSQVLGVVQVAPQVASVMIYLTEASHVVWDLHSEDTILDIRGRVHLLDVFMPLGECLCKAWSDFMLSWTGSYVGFEGLKAPSTLHHQTQHHQHTHTHTIYATSQHNMINATSSTQHHLRHAHYIIKHNILNTYHLHFFTATSTQHQDNLINTSPTPSTQHRLHSASFLLIPLLLFFVVDCSLFCFVDLFHSWMSKDTVNMWSYPAL